MLTSTHDVHPRRASSVHDVPLRHASGVHDVHPRHASSVHDVHPRHGYFCVPRHPPVVPHDAPPRHGYFCAPRHPQVVSTTPFQHMVIFVLHDMGDCIHDMLLRHAFHDMVTHDMVQCASRHGHNYVVGTLEACRGLFLPCLASAKWGQYVVELTMSWEACRGGCRGIHHACRGGVSWVIFTPRHGGGGSWAQSPFLTMFPTTCFVVPHDMGDVVGGCRGDILIYRCNSLCLLLFAYGFL